MKRPFCDGTKSSKKQEKSPLCCLRRHFGRIPVVSKGRRSMIVMDGAQTGGGRFLILQVKCTPPARICLFNSRSGLFKKKNPAPSYGLLTTIYRMNGVVSDGSFYHSNSSLHLSPSATLNQQAGGWSFSRGSIPAPTASSVETSDKMRRHPPCSPGPVRPAGGGVQHQSNQRWWPVIASAVQSIRQSETRHELFTSCQMMTHGANQHRRLNAYSSMQCDVMTRYAAAGSSGRQSNQCSRSSIRWHNLVRMDVHHHP